MIIQMYTKRGTEVDMPKRQQPNKRKHKIKFCIKESIIYNGKVRKYH